jgi:hypothetical protein
VGDTRDQRLLLSIVLMLFGILVTLVGGGPAGLIVGVVALVLAITTPPTRS